MENFFTNLIFPKHCLGCKKEGFYLCGDCRHLLEICEYNFCLCEQNPQRLFPASKMICPKCKGKKLSGLYFALTYKNNILAQKLIHQFKYSPYLKDLAPTLSSLLIEHFIKTETNTNEIWENSILIPVPLHSQKLRERGYNQSEELAKELAKILQIPVFSDVLLKIKQTKPQMQLKKEEREKNLQSAFTIKNHGKIHGKKIFLVDDVYTTGLTMQECASQLLSSGAKQVWGITIAREG